MNRTLVTLCLGLLSAWMVYLFAAESEPVRIGLALLTLVAILWMTETFHVSVTALLVPLLAVVSGVFTVREAFAQFANPVIYLFLGGFALATALHHQRIDQRIAQLIIGLARGRVRIALWLTFAMTAFVSMWISNTATAAMMMPLALGLLARLDYDKHRPVFWFVLLGVAYSANIGGIGTLVGSPPNAIAAANSGISFAEWLVVGLPTVVIALPLILMVLHWRYRPELEFGFDEEAQQAPFTRQQKLTLLVFLLTVGGWLFSVPLAKLFGIEKGFDAIVAMAAVVLLSTLRLMSWDEFQKGANWGVLILFGGGLTLSSVLQQTGASAYLGSVIVDTLQGAPVYLFILALTLFVVMLTEVASNTASSALLIPVFMPVAASFALPPDSIAMGIAIAASCAFMLPVATPPNAIVFGSGLVPQQQMMRCGVVLNLLMALLISLGIWMLA